MEHTLISGIDNVGICVEDVGRSVSFYETLGFQRMAENERGVTMGLGSAKLFLFESRVGRSAIERRLGLFDNPPGIDHISFLVSDVDALHAEVVDRGIPTAGTPADQDWGARAFGVRDPDGNNLYFLRWI